MTKKRNVWKVAASIGVLLAARSLIRKARAYDVNGKTVLITGGSRGLGLVLARQLAQQGAKIAICSRDPDELIRASQDLAEHHAHVFTIACDVTIQSEVEAMVKEVEANMGPIDVLINNAGVIQVSPFENTSLGDYEEAMRTHFYAPLYTVMAVAPDMQRRREGRIINISSFGGKVSAPHLIPYCASKFALVGFSRGLRAELAKDGVLVTTVCPGLIRTGSPRNVLVKGDHQSEYAWFKIGDSLPFISASAESAASQIVQALRNGDAEVVITLPAKIASIIDELFPEFSSDVLTLINRMLPKATLPEGNKRLRGYESESAASESILAKPSDRAAEQNNEIPGNPPDSMNIRSADVEGPGFRAREFGPE